MFKRESIEREREKERERENALCYSYYDLKAYSSLAMERDRTRKGTMPIVHTKRRGSPGGT